MLGVDEVTAFNAVLDNFPWSGVKTVCDVGFGVGVFSLPLAQMYPHIKITLHDLPETIGQARDIWSSTYPADIQEDRVTFSPLKFLENVPAKGQDIYYLQISYPTGPTTRRR